MRGPALAVVGSDGQLERSTAAFSSLGDAEALLDGHPEELERVLRGEASSATLTRGAVTAAIEAVVDQSGGRHALLTVSGGEEEVDASAAANPVLDEDLDSSPAVVFVKDLDGRYLRVNARHGKLIGGGEDKLLGKTDRELDAKLTVDGPRLKERDPADAEPQQLEYIVPAHEKRPALSVLRFLIHDRAGQPVALCGVAAPVNESAVARSEAERLMDLERFAHVDATAARDELLSRWGLAGGAAAAATVVHVAHAEPAALAPISADEQALAQALADEQQRVEDLERALAEATRQLGAAGRSSSEEVEDAMLRTEQARVQAEQAHAESEHLRAELELAHAETEQARAVARREHEDAESARAATQAARAEASQALLKIEQLEADSIQLRSRFEQAEAEARESRVRSEKADVEAVEARARADQAEIEVRQGRTRVEQAEADLRQARVRAEQAEADARQAKARVEQADGDIRQARARVEEAETEALRSSRRAEEAETALRQAKLEIEELESARRQARGQIEELESAATRARAAIEEAERSAREWRVRAEQAENELTAARAAASADSKAPSDAADRASAEWRSQLAAVQEKLGAAESQSGELRENLAAERARTEELRRLLDQAHERVNSLGVELAAAQAAELARQEAETAREAAEASRREAEEELAAAAAQAQLDAEEAEAAGREADAAAKKAANGRKGAGALAPHIDGQEITGLQWGARAQRQLAAALGDADELRSGFLAAADVLGVRGGWDLVAIWTPDQRGILRCAASWSREPLSDLERLSHTGAHSVSSRLGAALYARESVWIEDLPGAAATSASKDDDGPDRLAQAEEAGITTAVMLPIREGVARIGVLELLARTQSECDSEVLSALEAVGLQLGQFAALMRARRNAPGAR